jgi:hypothetical protein
LYDIIQMTLEVQESRGIAAVGHGTG